MSLLTLFWLCSVFAKRPPLVKWGQTPAKLHLESKLPDTQNATVLFTNTSITIDADPYYVLIDLLRPINASASSFAFTDGRLVVSAAKTRREPCWLRLGVEAGAAWLSVDHARLDLDGCRFYRELWRSEYFANLMDHPASTENSK